jgi:hypothetical protein
LANEIFTVLGNKTFVKFQTSNAYLNKTIVFIYFYLSLKKKIYISRCREDKKKLGQFVFLLFFNFLSVERFIQIRVTGLKFNKGRKRYAVTKKVRSYEKGTKLRNGYEVTNMVRSYEKRYEDVTK